MRLRASSRNLRIRSGTSWLVAPSLSLIFTNLGPELCHNFTLLMHKEINEQLTQIAEKGKACDGLQCCAKTSRAL